MKEKKKAHKKKKQAMIIYIKKKIPQNVQIHPRASDCVR
jgi:hypothetical protein